jgi:PAS domain S-box-containing protein
VLLRYYCILNPGKILTDRPISQLDIQHLTQSGSTHSLIQEIESLRLQVQELKQLNSDYEEIVEYATEVIFRLDSAGNFLFVSCEYERMLGFTNEEMQGRHFTSIIHDDDLPLALQTFQVLEKQGRADKAIDFRVRVKSGGYKWVTCSAICRFNEKGEPTHIIGLAHEVTQLYQLLDEQRSSEQALRVSEERYRSLFDALSEGAVLVDRQGIIRAANRSAERIFNVRRDYLLNLGTFESQNGYIHEDGTVFPIDEHPSATTLRTGQSFKDVVLGVQRPEEPTKWISINTEPIYYTDKSGLPDAVIVSFTDITQAKLDREELHRNQQLLAIENARYIRATKAVAQAVVDAQEKERAEIGFELHDNVNQILSTVRLYLDHARLNEEERLALIEKSSAGISDAVSEIRRICHSLVPASIMDIGLVASIEDLVESVRGTGHLNVEFYQRGEIELLPDQTKLVLFRIIQEQVTNVLKHAEASQLVLELIIDDSIISLSISDNGKGFDNETGKMKKGVGLHNISNRTELLNGKINIITAPGRGCKLNILIPI